VLRGLRGRLGRDAVVPRGTTQRGRDSQRRIADALIELVADGVAAPTARAVSEQAGVSLRLVFHHFESLEDIYRLAVVRLTVEHVDELVPVDATRPIAERVEQTVQQWARVYEAIAPTWRAASAMAQTMPSLRQALAIADSALAEHVRATFGPELAGTSGSVRTLPARSDDLFQLLHAGLSFESWDRLRRAQRLSAVRTRRVMTLLVIALLRAGTGTASL
jgi:TetR/AcrR family transcriptional regulator, regulator of autoinduction and epiphytic fitness